MENCQWLLGWPIVTLIFVYPYRDPGSPETENGFSWNQKIPWACCQRWLFQDTPNSAHHLTFGLFAIGSLMGVSENSGTPQIIHFNRDFHYFHHPFWGTPIFGSTFMGFLMMMKFIQVHAPSGSARTTSTTTFGGPDTVGTVVTFVKVTTVERREVRQKHTRCGPSKN